MATEDANSRECQALDTLAIMDLAQANLPPVVGTVAWDAAMTFLATRPAVEAAPADSLVDLAAVAG